MSVTKKASMSEGYASRSLSILNSLIRAAEKRAAQLARRGDLESALALRKDLIHMVHARRKLKSCF